MCDQINIFHKKQLFEWPHENESPLITTRPVPNTTESVIVWYAGLKQ